MALITGNALKNLLEGTAQDDILAGLAGDDTMVGGLGNDTAWFAGNSAGYRFSAAGQRLIVQDVNAADGQDGTEQVEQVEQLTFANGQFRLTGASFRVNTNPVDTQFENNVTALADGGFLVIWSGIDQAGTSYDVKAQRYDATGRPVGGEIQVNTTSSGTQQQGSVTALKDGGFVVAWSDYGGNDGDVAGAFVQRFGADGMPRGSEFSPYGSGTGFQANPHVTALEDGGFLVVWNDTEVDGDSFGITARRYDANGQHVPQVLSQVNTGTAGPQQFPVAAGLADGGYVIVWQTNLFDGDGAQIVARRYSHEGLSAGPDLAVNTTNADNQVEPKVAALADGGFVIVWASFGQDGSSSGVYGRRFDAAGLPVGGEFQVNTSTQFSQFPFGIATLADGGFIVAFQSDHTAQFNADIYLRRYNADGDAVGGEMLVSTYTIFDDRSPHIASLADGGFIVTWDSFGQGGNGWDVFAQRFDAQGQPLGLKLTGGPNADAITLAPGQPMQVDGGGGADTVTGTAGNDALAGGEGADSLAGGAGNDLLDGGTGADKLVGGAGDDEYVIDVAGDSITEAAGEGSDTVRSMIGLTLGPTLENLVLTGAAHVAATGNDFGNYLAGNSGNNTLDGKGGADLMAGGAGNDVYHVDNPFDLVVEETGQGNDLVNSAVSFSLSPTLENLTLTGAANIDGAGNDQVNSIQGNSGNNVLQGFGANDALVGGAGNDSLAGGDGGDLLTGGLGNDTINGGANSDIFVFNAALGPANVDVIQDYDVDFDLFYLSKAVMGNLGGVSALLEPSAFAAGAGFNNGKDPTDRIVYNITTGDLYYDADGSGAGAAVRFAVLSGVPMIDANDFVVTP